MQLQAKILILLPQDIEIIRFHPEIFLQIQQFIGFGFLFFSQLKKLLLR